MSHYQSFDPNTEVIGRSVQGFVKSIMHDDITSILERHGLNTIDPNAWYPLQSLLDVFNEIADEGVNISPIFVSIGMGTARASLEALPPQMKAVSLQEFLANFPARIRSLHRNGDVGSVQYQQVGDDHFVITLRLPYPDDLMYGTLYTHANFFKPQGKTISIAYDEHTPRRDNGGDVTIYHIFVRG